MGHCNSTPRGIICQICGSFAINALLKAARFLLNLSDPREAIAHLLWYRNTASLYASSNGWFLNASIFTTLAFATFRTTLILIHNSFCVRSFADFGRISSFPERLRRGLRTLGPKSGLETTMTRARTRLHWCPKASDVYCQMLSQSRGSGMTLFRSK